MGFSGETNSCLYEKTQMYRIYSDSKSGLFYRQLLIHTSHTIDPHAGYNIYIMYTHMYGNIHMNMHGFCSVLSCCIASGSSGNVSGL